MCLAGTTNPEAEAMKPFTGVSFFRHGEKPEPALDQDILAIVQVGRTVYHLTVYHLAVYHLAVCYLTVCLSVWGIGL